MAAAVLPAGGDGPEFPMFSPTGADNSPVGGFLKANTNAYSDNHERASSPYPVVRFLRCDRPRPAAERCAGRPAPAGAGRARS